MLTMSLASITTKTIFVGNMTANIILRNNINSLSKITCTCINNKNIVSSRYVSNRRYSKSADALNNKSLETIYSGALTSQIRAVKIVSFSTSLTGIITQPFLYKQLTAIGAGLPVFIGLSTFVGFFTFVTPFLLHFITKKYITQLVYNPATGKYTATILSFFCIPKHIEFSVDDVKVPEVPGMFTSFKANDIALFVDPQMFANPNHYGKLMGYDKPIDLKLYENDVKGSK